MQKHRIMFIISTLLIFCFGTIVVAQVRLPKVKKPKIELLGNFIKDDPLLTTSFDDAIFSIELLDDFDPSDFQDMRNQERDNGAFLLTAGNYQLEALSYCLHAGTYGPEGGDGYLLAELEGRIAPEIKAILRAHAFHPEISQRQVQILIWCLLSKRKVKDLPAEFRQVAEVLLTPEEIHKLNGGWKAYLPAQLKGEAFRRLPGFAKDALRAEAKINSLLSRGHASYEELERAAVLIGNPPEEGPNIPSGRWSLSKGGYFIRFFPEGYKKTTIQVVVPDKHTIIRDSLNRIVSVADSSGNRFETDYDDSKGVIDVEGDPEIKGYFFKRVRMISPSKDQPGEEQIVEKSVNGWTFVGRPNGKGRFALPFEERSEVTSGPSLASSTAFGKYDVEEWMDRYEKAKDFRDKLKDFQDENINSDAIDDLTDLDHYKDGMEAATGGDLTEKGEWIGEHTTRVERGWLYAIKKLAGWEEDSEEGGGDDDGSKEFNPSDFSAVPGNRAKQRLAFSDR